MEETRYKLKWNNHMDTFQQTFTESQHGEFLVDVTLSCGGQYIKAHKLILAAGSEYFNTIFQMHPNIQHPIIFLNGVDYKDLQYILDFIYSGEIKVLEPDLADVLALGRTLQVKGLTSVFFKDNPDSTNTNTVQESRKTYINKKLKLSPTATPCNVNLAPRPIEVREVLVPVMTLEDKSVVNRAETLKKPVEPQANNVNNVAPAKVVISVSAPNLPSVSAPNLPSVSAPNLPSVSAPKVPTISTPNLPVITEVKPFSVSHKKPNVLIPNILAKTSSSPKPPHAFMIFANEWRKKLTVENPDETTKQISVRLGNMWKTLLPETKNIYYREAKRAEEEHKGKSGEIKDTPNKRKSNVLNEPVNGNTSRSSAASSDQVIIIENSEEQILLIDSE